MDVNKLYSSKKYQDIKKYTQQYDPLNIESIADNDYLGQASSAKHRAKIALKEKDYEKAWDLYLKQSEYLMRASERAEPMCATTSQGRVSFDLANVLRLEKKHSLALAHLIYATATNTGVAYIINKLPAYVKRANLNVDFDEVLHFVYEQYKQPDFRVIQKKVLSWTS